MNILKLKLISKCWEVGVEKWDERRSGICELRSELKWEVKCWEVRLTFPSITVLHSLYTAYTAYAAYTAYGAGQLTAAQHSSTVHALGSE